MAGAPTLALEIDATRDPAAVLAARVAEFESVQHQAALMNRLPDEDQWRLLEETLENMASGRQLREGRELFDAYERAVRREYDWVEEPMWRAGRGAVLTSFLARPHIFHTDEFRQRFEPQARMNMARSLETLQKPS